MERQRQRASLRESESESENEGEGVRRIITSGRVQSERERTSETERVRQNE